MPASCVMRTSLRTVLARKRPLRASSASSFVAATRTAVPSRRTRAGSSRGSGAGTAPSLLGLSGGDGSGSSGGIMPSSCGSNSASGEAARSAPSRSLRPTSAIASTAAKKTRKASAASVSALVAHRREGLFEAVADMGDKLDVGRRRRHP